MLFNPVAQAKFVHTVSAGYVIASVTVLGISALYLLQHRHQEIARRSMTVAAAFGLAASLSVVVLGDESGYTLTDNQKMKLAAIEAAWHTEPAPAGITLFGVPDVDTRSTRYAVQVPWVLGLIATRSLDKEVTGMSELVLKAQERIGSGMLAYDAVEIIKHDPQDQAARQVLALHGRDLGYALLLKRFGADPRTRDRSGRSDRRRGTRFRTCPCCSGASGSWRRSASASSACSPPPSCSAACGRWSIAGSC